MYVSVRECMLPGVFGSIKAGLDAMGLDSVELEYSRDRSVFSLDSTSSEKESLAGDAAINAFGAKCSRLKCGISGLLLHNNFGAEDLEAELDWVICCLKAADRLGAKAVRIDAIMSADDQSLESRAQHFADCMAKVLDATSDLDVEMGVENHGRLGNEPEFLDLLFRKADSPRLGVTLDTANLYWYGHPLSKVHQIIEHFAPKVKHTHIKNINFPQNKREIRREIGWEYGKYASSLREGDIDMNYVVKVLRDAGYSGALCVEDESLGRRSEQEGREVMVDDARFLRELLQRQQDDYSASAR